MSETLRLLKYDPAVALLIMANNHFNITLRPEFTTVGDPVVVAGSETLTDVVIKTRDTIDEVIYSSYTGQMTYRYNRISVSEIFAGMSLDITPPITILGVLTNMAAASGLAFTEDDFENGLVESNSFVLKAKPNSLRWVGQTTVMLNEPGVSLQLADAFSNNILNGFYPPVFEEYPLPAVLAKPELNGLTYAPIRQRDA